MKKKRVLVYIMIFKRRRRKKRVCIDTERDSRELWIYSKKARKEKPWI